MERRLAEREAEASQLAARHREDQALIERLTREVAEHVVLVARLEMSLLAGRAVQMAQLKACIQQWGAEVAELQERLSWAADFKEQCDQQEAQIADLEARLARLGEEEGLSRCNTVSSLASSSEGSLLEAGLEWTGEGVGEEAERQLQPLLRRMRSSQMEETELPPDPLRLEELTAASLSQWVYTATVGERGCDQRGKLPQLPFVSLQAHCVLEDVKLGSLRVATATAQLPGGRKVFFVVFKGTSYLLDVVNWNVEHDYKETGDPASFVHKGAAGMVRNLLFLKVESELAFLQQLQAAFNAGVRRLVLAGHSLGGLYATAMLLAAFKQQQGLGPEVPPGVQQLLDSVRCVTFGAPMCFGSDLGSEQTPEFLRFEAFVRERAVNFIHEGDPCPRAWSAVDPRDLMSKAADTLKRGIKVERGRVKGKIAGRVVDMAIQGVLARPDFDRQIVGCSRDFRHLSRIRLLSQQNKPCLHWRRDFCLTKRGFEDHAVAKYLERLLEASNSERPSCQIYDDDELGSKITLLHLVS